jgi:hypothetical protein
MSDERQHNVVKMDDEKQRDLLRHITLNPRIMRQYFTNPQALLRSYWPGRSNTASKRRAELGRMLDEAIHQDRELQSARAAQAEVNRLARLITHNPEARANYFKNPGRALRRAIPRQGLLARMCLTAPEEIRTQRELLVDEIERVIDLDPRLVSTREAYFEKKAFLSEALENPQRTFIAIVGLSVVAVLTVVVFVVGALLAGFLGDGTTEKAVLGGLSGGGGVATSIGSIFTISSRGIRRANGDSAQIRLILTGFATEITHLRSLRVSARPEKAREINDEIREVTGEAVRWIERYAEPQEEQSQPAVQGAHSHPSQI